MLLRRLNRSKNLFPSWPYRQNGLWTHLERHLKRNTWLDQWLLYNYTELSSMESRRVGRLALMNAQFSVTRFQRMFAPTATLTRNTGQGCKTRTHQKNLFINIICRFAKILINEQKTIWRKTHTLPCTAK